MDSRKVEALPDYIRRVRAAKNLSTADVERNSGFTVTDGYVSHIENGRVKNVSPEKLRALAKGLQVDPDEIVAVAMGKPLTYEDPLDLRGLFDGWEEATDTERAAALDDVRMIAERFQRRRKVTKPVEPKPKPVEPKPKGKK